eukprot:CAMPEP_0182919134 /NCGR_PEP_ID=MMETSP0105_2-20130417/2476_1 /TAXON_ID=81532 ORGANISM="Acanthoeca-like sp., Strain 10tr" /NCGR_SAMPLE_ID=MMETSP0105_2 /ASSEMBLY_ACC=CAM_ASM_000205 /LENGTH=794 /DNA_ID=CAMNT_0025056259 /DNA_START=362 /DNA_END=2746 /DNA_ORIENTATION=+
MLFAAAAVAFGQQELGDQDGSGSGEAGGVTTTDQPAAVTSTSITHAVVIPVCARAVDIGPCSTVSTSDCALTVVGLTCPLTCGLCRTSTSTTTATTSTVTTTTATSSTVTTTTSTMTSTTTTTTTTTTPTTTPTTTATSTATSTATTSQSTSPTTSGTTTGTTSPTSTATSTPTTSPTTSATTSVTTSVTTSESSTPSTSGTSSPSTTATTTPTTTATSTATSTGSTSPTTSPTSTTATTTATTSRTTTETSTGTTSPSTTATTTATTSSTTTGTTTITSSPTSTETSTGTTSSTTSGTTSVTTTPSTTPTSTTPTTTPTTTEHFASQCQVASGRCFLDSTCRACAVDVRNSTTSLQCLQTNRDFLEVIRQCRMLCRPLYLLQADPATTAFGCWIGILRAPNVTAGIRSLSQGCLADAAMGETVASCSANELDDADWPDLFSLVINTTAGTDTGSSDSGDSNTVAGIDLSVIILIAMVAAFMTIIACWVYLFRRRRRSSADLEKAPPNIYNPVWVPDPPKPPKDWSAELEAAISSTRSLTELYAVHHNIMNARATGRVSPMAANVLLDMFSARAAAMFTRAIRRCPTAAKLHNLGGTVEKWASEALFTVKDGDGLKMAFVTRWGELKPQPRAPQRAPSTATTAAAKLPKATTETAHAPPEDINPVAPPQVASMNGVPISFKVTPELYAATSARHFEEPVDGLGEGIISHPAAATPPMAASVQPLRSPRGGWKTRRAVDGGSNHLVANETRERTASIRLLKKRGVDSYVKGLDNKDTADLRKLVKQTSPTATTAL